jgi:hypothetical protein
MIKEHTKAEYEEYLKKNPGFGSLSESEKD